MASASAGSRCFDLTNVKTFTSGPCAVTADLRFTSTAAGALTAVFGAPDLTGVLFGFGVRRTEGRPDRDTDEDGNHQATTTSSRDRPKLVLSTRASNDARLQAHPVPPDILGPRACSSGAHRALPRLESERRGIAGESGDGRSNDLRHRASRPLPTG